jgi:hypothetical protein
LRNSNPALGVLLPDLAQRGFDIIGDVPNGIITSECAEIGDPPTMVADPVMVGQLPVELSAGNVFA